MSIYASRLIEVPINAPVPKSYIHHVAKSIEKLPNEWFEAAINIDFHDVEEFFNALRDLFHLYKQKGHSYETNLDILILNHYKFS